MVLAQQELVAILRLARTDRQRRTVMAIMASHIVERPIIPNVRFDLASMTDANAILNFRFDVAGVQKLAFLLGLPAAVITASRNRVLRDEALCIVLSRMAFPTRFFDMAQTFGRSRSVLCDVFLHVLNELYDRWNPLLYFNTNLVAKNIYRYCAAINSRGAQTSRVFGFIDGTKLQVCRMGPSGNGDNLQKEIYSGHKRMHCLNYQAVTAPDGLCIHFFGPVEGRRHDTKLLRESGLLEFLSRNSHIFSEKCIYGDPAYGVSLFLVSGFKGNELNNSQKEFNKSMSRTFNIDNCLVF
ncbi:hypothetical protein H257_14547 [Aphanomyces astaci]|uniref:DDE Tnp4 domain-containing protein n=1 Tax=Aphanomyces astaci TaxID=112090 RepID=W4FS84_APHAT|nr:hypothetical protein H257_14547 [Aphanomyces astaci]ETV69684.1 hypothetical protein H257_14547 [Aphanomyces astaci]|eukprot:XP_009840698.1 hypothetical protein H257_14547 [Aphanomyces astaci]